MPLFQRLDVFLSKQRKDFSRNFYQKLIKKIGVRVNGKLIKKPHYLVNESDKVILPDDCINDFETSLKPAAHKAEFKKDQILFEDKDFLAIDKAPYIKTEDLTQGLFPVHRLDKNTSGVLLIAKNLRTQEKLQKQWRDRTVNKTYQALIKGRLLPDKGSIEGGIARSYKDRRKMALSSARGSRSSITEYKVSKNFNFKGMIFSYVEVFPLTGRTHQIRVHFSALGHPIIGDDLYGDKKLNKIFDQQFGLKRQFLHAQSLKFVNPNTKKTLTIKAKLPQDLTATLSGLLRRPKRASQ